MTDSFPHIDKLFGNYINFFQLDDTILTLVQRLMDNQDRFKTDPLVCGHRCQPQGTLSAPSGFKPLPIHQDQQNLGFSASNVPHSDTVSTGQTPTLQNPLNLAQGPLILNIGNLGSGQMMLVTNQNDASQLSILTGTTNSGQLTNRKKREVTSQVAKEVTTSIGRGMPSPSQLLCRSASLCEPNDGINPVVMARSQSQDSGNNSSLLSSGDLTNMNFISQQGLSSNVNNFCDIVSSRAENTCTSNLQQMDTKQEELNIDMNSSKNAFVQNNIPNSDANNFTTVFSSNNSNSTAMVSTFFEELNSSYISTDKFSPMEENKKGFGHLGDSFESLQGTFNTLQGSDLSLDQLDLIDMPELERMCSDLTSAGDISELSNAIEMSTNGCQKSENPENQKAEDISVNNTNISTLNASSFSQNGSGHRESFSTVSSDVDSNCMTCGTPRLQSQGQESVAQPLASRGDNLVHTTKTPSTITTITDFSPDWAYTEVCVNIFKD